MKNWNEAGKESASARNFWYLRFNFIVLLTMAEYLFCKLIGGNLN